MNSGTIIVVVAIVAPFLFAAWAISAVIRSRERKRAVEDHKEENRYSDQQLEKEIEELAKRIENLEIIMRSRHAKKE